MIDRVALVSNVRFTSLLLPLDYLAVQVQSSVSVCFLPYRALVAERIVASFDHVLRSYRTFMWMNRVFISL